MCATCSTVLTDTVRLTIETMGSHAAGESVFAYTAPVARGAEYCMSVCLCVFGLSVCLSASTSSELGLHVSIFTNFCMLFVAVAPSTRQM